MLEKIKYYITHPATLVTTGIALISTLGIMANFITHIDDVYKAPIELKRAKSCLDSVAKLQQSLERRFVADSLSRTSAEGSDYYAVGMRSNGVEIIYRDIKGMKHRVVQTDSAFIYRDLTDKVRRVYK